jgi:radical SAM superfamily enzyme YgiQ (UPF0313 family)
MLTLINTNTMQPAIAPIGLDYIAGMALQAAIETELVDLCLAENPDITLRDYFAKNKPNLIGLSFRNVDDCFWPSCQWFVPKLAGLVKQIKTLTAAPIVIGGVGFSIFAKQIVLDSGADFGVIGDGEQAIISLYHQLKNNQSPSRNSVIDGLLNQPGQLALPTSRNAIDNPTYFKRGGQIGLETKRGCNRNCIYCADRLSKGKKIRTRKPAEVADEAQALLAQGIDVLHICDSEFNVPGSHAKAVCEEFIRRGLGKKLRWYTYMAVTPFDAELASAMRKAGCVGIDFTGDSASSAMLKTYRQPHTANDLAKAVRLCKENSITVMFDLLLGGPGETPESAKETIRRANLPRH